ncbi:hypothetical protein GH714_040215 [Hevea brasiliensis]|uniref:Retrotransposon gag domain-containing protein n=1 Tax=Hevea brasiliensis TaxID=3981 RepID=A0A6A6MTP7_HEVBR|nr:hypothetical protein GH714_040215 [Hevea brasiliensis]
MTALWDQLSLSKPLWHDIRDAELYAKERDEFWVYQFTLALNDEFESVRSSLLHRDPFPKLEIVVTELLSEEAHLAILKSQQSIITTDTMLATLASSQSQNKVTCRYCHKQRHHISNCFRLQSKQGIGRNNQSKFKSSKAPTHTTAAATERQTDDQPMVTSKRSSTSANSVSPPTISSPSNIIPSRVRHPPSYLHDYHYYSAIVSLHEPSSYKEASTNPL